MKFCTERLKPVIEGKVGNRQAKLLADSGADWTILTVPRYKTEKNSSGIKEKKMLFLQAEYDKMIVDDYGVFVPDGRGGQIKTTVHGFGGIEVVCRLIILRSFSFGDYEFKDSYVLLDEEGSASNHDMILGTSVLRNFKLSIDYDNREVEFTPNRKEIFTDYSGIIQKNDNNIEGLINIPTDIYLLD